MCTTFTVKQMSFGGCIFGHTHVPSSGHYFVFFGYQVHWNSIHRNILKVVVIYPDGSIWVLFLLSAIQFTLYVVSVCITYIILLFVHIFT
jgi:hypothetical protein